MIIFISGSINSGKTTISQILADQIPCTALIEVDTLRHMVSWMPLDESIPLNLVNTASLMRNFLQKKLNVIVAYPLSQENYDYLISSVKDLDTENFAFTLSPELEKVTQNRGSRELTKWEIERIKHHYVTGISNPTFGEVIDNTDQTPQETAKYIFNTIKDYFK